jgi:guanylate kinase
MADAGELLEWAEVFGHLYGTPAESVNSALAEGRTIVLDVDVQGGRQVCRQMPEAVFVLIVPPSEAELARRLAGRGSEDQAQLAERLAKADAEVKAAIGSGIYDHVVVNDDLEQAVRRVVEIVEE